MIRYFINKEGAGTEDEYYDVVRVGQQEGWSSYLGNFNTYEMALACVEAYIDWQGGVLDGEEEEDYDIPKMV